MPAVRDIMSRRVVTIAVDATLADAAKVLCENSMSGAPVVAENGDLVGLIAEPGLIDVLFDEEARRASVSDYMAREVHVVNPDDSLAEAARLLALYGIRRLPVIDDGKVIGMVSRRDLINYTLRSGEVLSDPLIELIPWLAPMV